MKLARGATVLFVAAMACAAACGNGEDETALDASFDQTVDSPAEAAADAAKDVVAKDAPAEAGDAGADASDASVDAVEEVVVEASVEAGVDATADVVPDVVVVDAGGSCTSNADCPSTDFCDKKNGDCGGAGKCTARPQICPLVVFPVCGCDKQTYSNSCYANKAGESIDYTGACE